jgi:hypothetical protein
LLRLSNKAPISLNNVGGIAYNRGINKKGSSMSIVRPSQRIRLVLLSGMTKELPYTNSGLAWAKEMFESGNLMSWELIEI